jgi:hypothetical protein
MKCTLRWKQAEDAASWRQCWLEMALVADSAALGDVNEVHLEMEAG